MLTLYHLSVSHFSEKARWALDLKGLAFRSRPLVPGLHRLTVKRVGGGLTVPVLVDSDSGATVNDSTDILHYLDSLEPEPALFPEDPGRAARVLEIEEFFDESCARHVGRYLFGFLLQHPTYLRARWERGLSGRQRWSLALAMPLLRWRARRWMAADTESPQQHRAAILAACDRLEEWLAESGGEYLVGDELTAADLAAACILGPVARPPGSPWADTVGSAARMPAGYPPPELQEFRRQFGERPAAEWVLAMWARHRQPAVATSLQSSSS